MHRHYLVVHQQPRFRGHWHVPGRRSWRQVRCTSDKWPRITRFKEIPGKGGNRCIIYVCNVVLFLEARCLNCLTLLLKRRSAQPALIAKISQLMEHLASSRHIDRKSNAMRFEQVRLSKRE